MVMIILVHGFLRSDSGGAHNVKLFKNHLFKSIVYKYIFYINADSVDATVQSEMTDMVQYLHSWKCHFQPFQPVVLSSPICPLS